MSEALCRVVLVDKPIGPTSFDMVRIARRGLEEKVGHAGTLDPFASGLLVILIGRATRASDLLMRRPKEYEMTVQFGAVSTTADATGDISETGVRVNRAQVVAALDGFRGTITQRVPMTSAVKVGGEALYRKAHRGESIETPEREVTIFDLRLEDLDEQQQTARLVAVTQSGTYMRCLAEDMGEVLGAGGYAASLRRTRSGDLSVADALSPDGLSVERFRAPGRGVLTLDDALSFMEVLDVDEKTAGAVANGNPLTLATTGRFRVRGPSGLLAIYEGDGEKARPLMVFPRG